MARKDWKEKFIAALAKGKSVTAAARAAKVARPYVYEVKDSDPEFAQLWEDAIEQGTDRLEDEAYRRAHDGTDKPVYQQGEMVGFIRQYSDSLIIFLLKSRRPEKYKDTSDVKVSGSLNLIAQEIINQSDAKEFAPPSGNPDS